MERINPQSWTQDCGLSPAHTDSGPDWALACLTSAECRSICPKILKAGIFPSAFLFSPFFLFKEDDKIYDFFPGSRRVSSLFICLFLYLFLFACHAAIVVVVVVTGFVLKRLFASLATVCLEVGTSAVIMKHHVSSRSITPLSQLPRKWSNLSKLTRSWRRQLEIVMKPFFRARHT